MFYRTKAIMNDPDNTRRIGLAEAFVRAVGVEIALLVERATGRKVL